MASKEKIQIKLQPDMAALAPGYLSNRKNDLVVLKNALVQNNFETIRKLSHKMKGTAGGYGFVGLSVIVKDLEIAANSKDLPQASTLVDQIENYLENIEILVVD